MSTADDDDEKTLSGPPDPGAARPRARDDDAGVVAERRRGAGAELQPGHTLPQGTRLRDYEITGLIGEGGFGIVYLAWDHSLQRKVAIKEYMPASMAARVSGSSAIVVKSDRHLDTFRAGLKSFVNEARLLARFDHPSLVKVYRFWEENGTAYMVMPYYEGPTLKAALAELGRAPSEAELRAWLKPLLDALVVMHAAQCYHRDIAPDNILLTPRGPLLLDFGAARRVIGDMTHAITVVLKPGYAPIEQYGDVATMAQGAWTDLYALACVVYYAIAGKTPVSSVERLMDDRVEPLATFAAGRYSDAFLIAVDAALAVRPADRPQTVRQFRALLDAGLPPQPADEERDSGAVPFATVPGTLTPTPRREQAPPSAFVATVARTGAAAVPDTALAPGSTSRNSAATLLVGAAIVAVIATVAVFVWLQQQGTAPPAATLSAPSRPTPAAGIRAAESPPAIDTPAARPSAAETPIGVAPGVRGASAIVERAPNEAAPPVATTIERAPETAPAIAPPEARAPADADAASSGVAAAATRTPRPRREAAAPARADNATATKPAPPHAPVVSSRCSDILQKASLEPLTATEAAYLKKECR